MNKPTTVFYNGTIITLDPALPQGEAMAVAGDKILAVGTREDINSLAGPGAKAVDLAGRVIVPGFNDSHMHLLNWGLGLSGVDLTKARSVPELVRLGREFLAEHPEREWLVGRGWNEENFVEKVSPSKADLDQISRSRPVVFIRACGHICTANSKALEKAGITQDTANPPGGSIDRSGPGEEPTGILRENAIALVTKLIPSPTKTDLREIIRQASRSAAALGLTTVQSNDLSGAGSFDTELAVYRKLAAENELPIRVNLQATMPTIQDIAAYLKVRKEEQVPNSYLTLGPLKLYADGSLGGRTAALTYPYKDEPGTCGMPLYEQAQLDELVFFAAKGNLQVAVHAIGDLALDMVLTSFAKAKKREPHWKARPRVVHCQIARREQFLKMSQLGIVADIQPIFVPTDLHFVEERIGRENTAYAYAWRTMLQKGIKAAGGSDCPVEDCNPLWGMHAAITRQDRSGFPPNGWQPKERLTPLEALRLFTLGSAYAEQAELQKGTLSAGRLADFVVLPENPLEVNPRRLLEMKVQATYVAGQLVFSAD